MNRRVELERRLDEAHSYIASLPLGKFRAYIVGSVARGDFVRESDTDILIISDELPVDFWERAALLEGYRLNPRIEAIGWREEEWTRHRLEKNPLLDHWEERAIRL
jgi:predicted nucleotidyltransferase